MRGRRTSAPAKKKGRGSKQTLIFNQLLEEKVLTFLTPIVKKGPLWVFSAKNHAKKKEEAAWQGSTTRVQKPRIVQGRMDSKRWDTLESISILNDTATRHLVRDSLSFCQNFVPILSEFQCQICKKAFRVNFHFKWHCNKAFGPIFLEFWPKFCQSFEFLVNFQWILMSNLQQGF